MTYRSTMVYLALALLLGGLYFWDVHREKEEKTREEEARVLFDVATEDLDRISLERPAGRIVVERIAEDESENTWTVTSPVSTAADDFSVNRIATLLPHLKYGRVVEEDPDDLGAFGLEPAALTVSWKTRDREGALSIGGKSPIDKDFYAKTGDKSRVLMLAAVDKEVLDKDLYDLRDKSLFTLPSDRVTRFVIERPTGSWTFARSGETTWALEGEADVPLDSESIQAAVRRLTWAEAASFEQEQADDLEPYGLDRPSSRVVLADGTTREELLVGAPAESGEDAPAYYARMAGRPAVLTVPGSLLEELPASLEDVRGEASEEEPSGEN